MIQYSALSLWDFLRLRGSMVPKGLSWALPSAALAFVFHRLMYEWTEWSQYAVEPSGTARAVFTIFTSVVGFLIALRAQQSYARYWEGITLVERACGVWLNGCSNLIAFCSTAREKQDQVDEFQYILSRLMSLVVCYSMCDIAKLERSNFPHLEVDGLDPKSLVHLDMTSARQYVALQWIQRLVVENARTGVIDIQPPILSRVFQELSIGIVHFIDAHKVAVVPYPFAFAQILWWMLIAISIVLIPLVCAVSADAPMASVYTFLVVFVYWSVYYTAVEIERPFGKAENHLPLDKLNKRFNSVLSRLLEAKAQQMPHMIKKPSSSVRYARRTSCSSHSISGRTAGFFGGLKQVFLGSSSSSVPGALDAANHIASLASSADSEHGKVDDHCYTNVDQPCFGSEISSASPHPGTSSHQSTTVSQRFPRTHAQVEEDRGGAVRPLWQHGVCSRSSEALSARQQPSRDRPPEIRQMIDRQV